MQFKDIIGQDAIKKQLIAEVNVNRIPHAQLFQGAAGVGSLPLALAYAQYINCTNKQSNDSCGECASCRTMNKLIHPDLHFVFPIVKRGKKLSDDFLPEWRELATKQNYFNFEHWLSVLNAGNSQAIIYSQESEELIRKLSFKSSQGGYKIVIIWLPEKMHITFAYYCLLLFCGCRALRQGGQYGLFRAESGIYGVGGHSPVASRRKGNGTDLGAVGHT